MKTFLPVMLAAALPMGAMAEGAVRLTMTSWHLTPATDVAITHSATCGHGSYTLTVTRSPQAPRASTVALAFRDGTTHHTADLTQTPLGQLLVDPAGLGELRFACRPQRLLAFYRGATLASESATPVRQDAVFALSPEGQLSVPPPEGITETPVR
jgi:hypothetical protein